MFYDWVSKRWHLLLIILLLIPLSFSNGIPIGISSYITGGLSAIPADVTMAAYAYAAGTVCAIPIIPRMALYFSHKQVLLISFASLVILHLVFIFNDQPLFVVMGSFMIGVFKIIGVLEMLNAMLPILMPNGERHRLYAVYYPVTLICTQLSSLLLTWLADAINWQCGFLVISVMLLMGLLLIIVFVKDKFDGRRIPLYQIDWAGMILVVFFMLMVDYVVTYGQKEDWYTSRHIVEATVFAILGFCLLMLRTTLLKRPFLSLPALGFRNVSIGLAIIFLMSLFFSVSLLQTTQMTLIFHNNPVENSWVNAFQIAGFVVGNLFCFLYYSRFSSFKWTIIAAVCCYMLSAIQLFFLMGPDAGPRDMFMPMFFRGAGTIIFYTAIGIYMADRLPFKHFFAVVFYLLTFRTFLGPVVWTSVLSNLYYHRLINNIERVAVKTDRINYFSSGSAVPQFFGRVQQQAAFLSLKEIFGMVILAGVLLIAGMLLTNFNPEEDRSIPGRRLTVLP